MLLRLLLLFTVVPLVELVLLLVLADSMGWRLTLGLVLATGVAGAGLARWQGLRCLGRLREQSEAGQIPAGPLMDGLLILIAAAMLVTPGMLTDLFGFALLMPWVRAVFKRRVRRYWELRFPEAFRSGEPRRDPSQPPQDRIIDVRVSASDEDHTS